MIYAKMEKREIDRTIGKKGENCVGVQVLTDSTSYLTEEIRKKLNIRRVSLSLSFGDKSMKEVDIENETFYEMMEEKGIPTSSQPSVEELYREMEDVVEKGDSLCCIFLSSEMSGTLFYRAVGEKMILEKYEDAKRDY